MSKKRKLKNLRIFKVLSKISLFLLLSGIFSSFYLWEQGTTFVKKRHAFSSRGEKVDWLSIPEIVFCPKPCMKPSVAEKYGYALDDPSFLWKDRKETYLKFNKTIWQSYHELTYHANKDYELTFEYTSTFGEETYTSELKPASQKEIALYSHGMCTMITFSNVVKPNILWKMDVKYNSSTVNQDTLKGFKIFVSTLDTLHGLLIDEWPYEKLILDKIEHSFDVSKYVYITLNEAKVQYMTAKSHNNPNECIRNFLNSSSCAFKCFPIVFNYMDFPPCTTKDEVWCMLSEIYGPKKMQLYDCLKPKKATMYRVTDIVYNEPEPQNDTMQVKFVYQSNIRALHEQVYVMSWTSLIGNVGGSLGLFFGFSFLTVSFKCIDKIFKRLQRAVTRI